MANLATFEFDATSVLDALEALSDVVLERHTKPAARVTADNVAREASARVRRRTGETARGIEVREDYERAGYIVESKRQQFPLLPYWLEFGTQHMLPSPYFFASASLEEGPHERRMRQAIVDAIEESGLGGQ